jgi:transcriptional regulator with XRE-family HTH domain
MQSDSGTDMDITEQGLAIRTARLAQRMTQAHLAQAAGVSEKTVRRAEQGERLQPESVRAISAILGLDATALRSEAEIDPRAAEGHLRETRRVKRLVTAMGASFALSGVTAVLFQRSGIGLDRAMAMMDFLWLFLLPLQVATWFAPLLLFKRVRAHILDWFVNSKAVVRAFAWAPLYASFACFVAVPVTLVPAALMIPWFMDSPDIIRGLLTFAFVFSAASMVMIWSAWIAGWDNMRLLADLPVELGRELAKRRPVSVSPAVAPR